MAFGHAAAADSRSTPAALVRRLNMMSAHRHPMLSRTTRGSLQNATALIQPSSYEGSVARGGGDAALPRDCGDIPTLGGGRRRRIAYSDVPAFSEALAGFAILLFGANTAWRNGPKHSQSEKRAKLSRSCERPQICRRRHLIAGRTGENPTRSGGNGTAQHAPLRSARSSARGRQQTKDNLERTIVGSGDHQRSMARRRIWSTSTIARVGSSKNSTSAFRPNPSRGPFQTCRRKKGKCPSVGSAKSRRLVNLRRPNNRPVVHWSSASRSDQSGCAPLRGDVLRRSSTVLRWANPPLHTKS